MSGQIEGVDRVPIEDVADSWGELCDKLHNGDLPPRPFWLMFDDSGFKVTEENRKALSYGMMIRLECKLRGMK